MTSESAVKEGAVLVNARVFAIERSRRREMNRIARDYAESLNADIALVRTTGQSGQAILFSVEAFRRTDAAP